jgi:hypothetical protein
VVAQKFRRSEAPFVAHLGAVEEVVAHVIIVQFRALLGQLNIVIWQLIFLGVFHLLGKGNFAQRRVGAQGEEGKVGVVEEIFGREAMGQNVDHADRNDAAVEPVLLVERAQLLSGVVWLLLLMGNGIH